LIYGLEILTWAKVDVSRPFALEMTLRSIKEKPKEIK
jgi:hypothetical protein